MIWSQKCISPTQVPVRHMQRIREARLEGIYFAASTTPTLEYSKRKRTCACLLRQFIITASVSRPPHGIDPDGVRSMRRSVTVETLPYDSLHVQSSLPTKHPPPIFLENHKYILSLSLSFSLSLLP